MSKRVHIFGGGTIQWVSCHFFIGAPSKGSTARQLAAMFYDAGFENFLEELTYLADSESEMATNEDVAARLSRILQDPDTGAIIMSAAILDFEGQVPGVTPGRYAPRLESRDGPTQLSLTPAKKLLARIKEQRPDIYVVGFKTTCNKGEPEMIEKSLRQLDEAQVDLVFANDVVTRTNLLVYSPEVVVRGSREELLEQVAATVIARCVDGEDGDGSNFH